ncbi:hypothetical protein EB796_023383 [Bugula neritina]|uniref:Uncharacterized protein n=1 Tax=Bugula neritina TaxID=10212 RepID=A0A7J7IXN2_BUGNE|nr:hypothetical protein EB796_023383 [Bugula neritina]
MYTHAYTPVTVHYSVESVCNSKNSAVRKFTSYCLLYDIISLEIYSCSSLIHYRYLCFTEKSSCQAYQVSSDQDSAQIQSWGIFFYHLHSHQLY